MCLLTHVETDRLTASPANEVRSAEAVAIARILNAQGAGLSVAWEYYGDPDQFRGHLQHVSGQPGPNIFSVKLWDELRDDVLRVITILSTPDVAAVGPDDM